MKPRLGECILCRRGHWSRKKSTLVVYPIQVTDFIALICEPCIQAVCDRGPVEAAERAEVGT